MKLIVNMYHVSIKFCTNLLVFGYKCRSVVGYAAHYLFCQRQREVQAAGHLLSVFEEDHTKATRLFTLDLFAIESTSPSNC